MNSPQTLSRHCSALASLVLGLFSAATSLVAQPATGTITGRIFNPATGEYVRNAELSIDGTNIVTSSEGGGVYTFSGVQAGEVRVIVRYTGYTAPAATLVVRSGQTVTHDFELTSTQPGRSRHEVVKLGEFVVSSDREGNAKAIMDQRRDMNISTSVASDLFGDSAAGNVGEFLKFLPGVDLDEQSGAIRMPALGGLEAQYTGVALDGVQMASADFTRVGTEQSRASSFETMTLDSVESVTISRSLSADMDADSPAGRINMKTKRAFDRKGRRISYKAGVTLNSEAFTLAKTFGPDEREHRKARPTYAFGYSESFLNNRLGVLLNITDSSMLLGQDYSQSTYNTSPTASDPRPVVILTQTFRDGGSFDRNFGAMMTTDYRATSHLTFSFSVVFNKYETRFRQPTITFSAPNRQAMLGDGLTTLQTTTGTVAIGGTGSNKLTNTISYLPRVEYTRGSLQLSAVAAFSHAKNDYEGLERGWARSADLNTLPANWRATRPHPHSVDWTVTQLSGPDWSNLANFTNPRLSTDGRYAMTEKLNGQLDARYMLPGPFQAFVKFGGKFNEELRKAQNKTPYLRWRYDGPGGGPNGTWAFLPSQKRFDLRRTNWLTIDNLPVLPDRNSMAELFYAHPEYFTHIGTANDYYSAEITSKRELVQRLTAGYGTGNARFGRLQVQGGMRWERTQTISKEVDPRPLSEVRQAGFPVSTANGRATTIPGLQYQFESKPRVKRTGQYDNWFPSASAKFNFARNFNFHLGYHMAISRPPMNAINGVWDINEEQLTIRAPNAALKPEISDNIVGRLAYYFEPVGSFTFQVNQNTITDLRITREYTSAEFGYSEDPEFADYTFISTTNDSSQSRRFRSMEVGYNQMLSFLPGLLRSTNVSLGYTRFVAYLRRPGRTPHKISGNIAWNYSRYNLRFGAIWLDDTPIGNYGNWRPAHARYDLGGGIKLNRYASLYFHGRNIFVQDDISYWGPVEFQNGTKWKAQRAGAVWQFGVKGEF